MLFQVVENIDSVDDLLGEYEHFLSDKATGTMDAYLRTVRHLLGWLAQYPGNEGQFLNQQLTRITIELYLAHLEQEGLSLNHRARVKSTISNFASFLIEEKGLLLRNPTRGIDLPPVPLPTPRPLSAEQRRVLRSLDTQEGDRRGAAIFALGFWAGCSVSDVSWLRMAHAHVDPQDGWLHIGYQGSKGRDIRLLHKAHRALYAYLQTSRACERTYVFKSQRGERLTEEGIRHWFRTLKAQATESQWELIRGLTFHDLRYDFAYRAREAGWPRDNVAKYFGLASKQGALPTFW